MSKTKSWFIERINKTGKPLTRLTKKRERIQISQIRNGKGDITTDTAETPNNTREHYEQLHTNKFDNLDEENKFLETYCPSKSNQEETDNLNRLITGSEIEP